MIIFGWQTWHGLTQRSSCNTIANFVQTVHLRDRRKSIASSFVIFVLHICRRLAGNLNYALVLSWHDFVGLEKKMKNHTANFGMNVSLTMMSSTFTSVRINFWRHICERDGSQDYYASYLNLRERFRDFHFFVKRQTVSMRSLPPFFALRSIFKPTESRKSIQQA